MRRPRDLYCGRSTSGSQLRGCGFAGCRNFSEALVRKAEEEKTIEGLNCPVGGSAVMNNVAAILGLEAPETDPLIAVVRCNGSFANAPAKVSYDGPSTCAFANNLYAGTSGCAYGCLGLGDCVLSCKFDAIFMEPETGLPVVKDNCIACGACVKACPRGIIELRAKGKKDRRIYVCCINKEKRRTSPEKLFRCLYRMRKMRGSLYFRCHYPDRQSCLYRFRKMQTLQKMRPGLSDKCDPRNQFPTA